jgi:hypothetical protein
MNLLYANIEKLIKSSESLNIDDILINSNIKLEQSDLKHMDFIPLDVSDYIDIDTIDLLQEFDNVPKSEKQYKEWYAENFTRINSEWHNLYKKIQNFIIEIDKKYQTNYASSRMLGY